jgi:hypothetical protein
LYCKSNDQSTVFSELLLNRWHMDPQPIFRAVTIALVSSYAGKAEAHETEVEPKSKIALEIT